VFWLWVALTVLIVVETVVSAFDDPRILPSNIVALVAWVGWTVGLRYWAATKSERAALQRATA
jgi:hypothetical protein